MSVVLIGQQAFAGRWAMGRVITDLRGGPDGSFAGMATLEPRGATCLTYLEEGQLQLGDLSPMAASRRYIWQFALGGVAVSFADGRPFHSFRLAESGAGSDHLCGADLYRVSYDFDAWPVWSAHWQVTGPRKDYTMLTRYARC